jgi:hypothetical protein
MLHGEVTGKLVEAPCPECSAGTDVWDAETGVQLRRIRGRMYRAEDVHAFTLGRLIGAWRPSVCSPASAEVVRLQWRADAGWEDEAVLLPGGPCIGALSLLALLVQ